ncbi:hypothetical protein HD806DRAFT_147787 [Xylariaceae sp. AK1471]|nr:hypothetical protein HD806DRAFT_147787 [Xylariaceae sp. AK1471]
MRFSTLVLFSPLAEATVGEILVNFDPNLEGRVDVLFKVEEVIGQIYAKAQFSDPLDRASNNQGLDAIDARSLLGLHDDLDALVGKRQSYCDPGYGYCSAFGRCCPDYDLCCKYGYCIEVGHICCPNGSCPPGNNCCGQNNCAPVNSECCGDGSYCYAGNQCYILPGEDRDVCCTNSKCTAHVDENGSTSYASTTTTTRTYTTTSTQYYYWTVTWWYWYYYWTYSVRASIVTSSQSTTTSAFSVLTTDANAASSYFSELSKTIVLPTPSAATSLESLAGSTLAESTSSRSTSSGSTSSRSISSRSTSSGSTSASKSATTSISFTGSPVSGDGPGNSAARGLWSQLDGFTVGFLTFGVGVGLVAALL